MTETPKLIVNPESDSAGKSDGKRLAGMISEIIRSDIEVISTLRSGIAEEDMLEDQARSALYKARFHFTWKAQEIESAEQKRDEARKTRSNLKAQRAAKIISTAGWAGVIILAFVGIEKWTDHLIWLPIWPFVSAPLILLLVISPLFLASYFASQVRAESEDRAKIILLNRALREQLRSLIVIPALEQVTSLNFIAPDFDIVNITDGAGLSSLVESDGRIQTGSYREILLHLGRCNGVAIGLAGARGIGKSELLRAFCGDLAPGEPVEERRTIGIIVPAPVAYQPESFLRLLIRRLAEEVPGYKEYSTRRARMLSMSLNILITLIAAACIIVGILLRYGVPSIGRHVAGWSLVALGCIVLLWPLVKYMELLKMFIPMWPRRGKGKSGSQETETDRQSRRRLAAIASEFVRRVRYVETRTASSEGSASWQSIGFKRTEEISLGQVPLTEPDLVFEFSRLVQEIHKGGYEIRIGIDELDKLANGEDAERFLTNIKVLFPIRNCSFILTISEDASAQFARRGMPIRDVFDSSLDTAVVIQALTFREAKRLFHARMPSEHPERMSDSQILLCYCLAGGLPRDFLRFCRQLGELNSKAGVGSTLDKMISTLLCSEVHSRIHGVITSLRGRNERSNSSAFLTELEMIEEAYRGDQMLGVLSNFMSSDPDFRILLQSIRSSGRASDSKEENNWISDMKRQLYSYLYFVESVREAFGPGWRFADPRKSSVDEFIQVFEFLAEAKRHLEVDAAAGWRRITQARKKFGLRLLEP